MKFAVILRILEVEYWGVCFYVLLSLTICGVLVNLTKVIVKGNLISLFMWKVTHIFGFVSLFIHR